MSLQEPLPLDLPQRQPPKARLQEADLLRRLQQARSDPELGVLRQLLAVRLDLCRNKLVKASLNDVPLLQGEARAWEKLLADLSGERVPPE
jgi:hypothetical protein